MPLPTGAAAPPKSGTPLVVALVEDDRLLREEIEVHLNAHGFEVHAVNSASALDDLLTQVAVDLYILDLGLPGESGLSLSRRLRSQMPHSGIVIMTARVALYDRIAGYQDGGADIYLTKPVAPDELVLVLRSLARRLLPSKVWSCPNSPDILTFLNKVIGFNDIGIQFFNTQAPFKFVG